MDFIAILELVLALLADCRQTRPRSDVLTDIQTPGPFARIALRLKLRNQGLDRKQVNEAMAMIEENAARSSDEAEEILNAAEEIAVKKGFALCPDDCDIDHDHDVAAAPVKRGGSALAGVLVAMAVLFAPAAAVASELSFTSMVAAADADSTADRLAEVEAKLAVLEAKLAAIRSCECEAMPTPAKSTTPVSKPAAARTEQSVLGHWQTTCSGGSCTRVWVPANQSTASQPVYRSQPRRGLFRRR